MREKENTRIGKLEQMEKRSRKERVDEKTSRGKDDKEGKMIIKRKMRKRLGKGGEQRKKILVKGMMSVWERRIKDEGKKSRET